MCVPFFSLLDKASSEFGGGEFDEDGILAETFNAAPGDPVTFGLPEWEKSGVTRDQQCGDTAGVGVQFDG